MIDCKWLYYRTKTWIDQDASSPTCVRLKKLAVWFTQEGIDPCLLHTQTIELTDTSWVQCRRSTESTSRPIFLGREKLGSVRGENGLLSDSVVYHRYKKGEGYCKCNVNSIDDPCFDQRFVLYFLQPMLLASLASPAPSLTQDLATVCMWSCPSGI